MPMTHRQSEAPRKRQAQTAARVCHAIVVLHNCCIHELLVGAGQWDCYFAGYTEFGRVTASLHLGFQSPV
jgi:hypothetical protein